MREARVTQHLHETTPATWIHKRWPDCPSWRACWTMVTTFLTEHPSCSHTNIPAQTETKRAPHLVSSSQMIMYHLCSPTSGCSLSIHVCVETAGNACSSVSHLSLELQPINVLECPKNLNQQHCSDTSMSYKDTLH